MTMAHGIVDPEGTAGRNEFFVAEDCHPQTIAVIEGRSKHLGIKVTIGPIASATFSAATCGVIVQYPTTDGRIEDYKAIAAKAHEAGAMVIAAADLLALTLITPPGEWGADICVGNSQRFGVPLGFGGPHAAFIATKTEFVRKMPGRIIGVSRDSHGNTALRMAIQTREQHIRRERATSNICTAQVLLAITA
jgi:glycine dehydrogenase